MATSAATASFVQGSTPPDSPGKRDSSMRRLQVELAACNSQRERGPKTPPEEEILRQAMIASLRRRTSPNAAARAAATAGDSLVANGGPPGGGGVGVRAPFSARNAGVEHLFAAAAPVALSTPFRRPSVVAVAAGASVLGAGGGGSVSSSATPRYAPVGAAGDGSARADVPQVLGAAARHEQKLGASALTPSAAATQWHPSWHAPESRPVVGGAAPASPQRAAGLVSEVSAPAVAMACAGAFVGGGVGLRGMVAPPLGVDLQRRELEELHRNLIKERGRAQELLVQNERLQDEAARERKSGSAMLTEAEELRARLAERDREATRFQSELQPYRDEASVMGHSAAALRSEWVEAEQQLERQRAVAETAYGELQREAHLHAEAHQVAARSAEQEARAYHALLQELERDRQQWAAERARLEQELLVARAYSHCSDDLAGAGGVPVISSDLEHSELRQALEESQAQLQKARDELAGLQAQKKSLSQNPRAAPPMSGSDGLPSVSSSGGCAGTQVAGARTPHFALSPAESPGPTQEDVPGVHTSPSTASATALVKLRAELAGQLAVVMRENEAVVAALRAEIAGLKDQNCELQRRLADASAAEAARASPPAADCGAAAFNPASISDTAMWWQEEVLGPLRRRCEAERRMHAEAESSTARWREEADALEAEVCTQAAESAAVEQHLLLARVSTEKLLAVNAGAVSRAAVQ